jgi:membrane protease subunit HflC
MMQGVWETYKGPILAVIAVLMLALSSMVVVPETEQAVVIQAGRPDRVINRYKPNQPFGSTGAGIQWRIPFYERLERIDKRVLNVDMESQQVLSTDQLRLNVDAYARYRIIDPVRMVRSAGTLSTVDSQLSQILSSVVRQELGRRSFASLLTPERGTTMHNIRNLLDTQARKFGAQVIDVRIKRADLPDGTPLDSAFQRMKTARDQEANTILAQGQKNAQIIRATAEAQAAKISADAFGKDPSFYDFYRAMQSYDSTFASGGEKSTQFIMDQNNDYLRQFRTGGH